jgi:hypothetical protein
MVNYLENVMFHTNKLIVRFDENWQWINEKIEMSKTQIYKKLSTQLRITQVATNFIINLLWNLDYY